MVIYFVMAFVVIIALFANGALAGFGQGAVPETLGEMIPAAGALWGVAGVLLIPGSFAYGAVMTLLCAPFVSACRQLLDGAPQDDAAPAMV
jgi:hypothetical protein